MDQFILEKKRNINEISSKTMMSLKHQGLFFIGEVVDVTGHLGVIIFNGLGLLVLLLENMFNYYSILIEYNLVI